MKIGSARWLLLAPCLAFLSALYVFPVGNFLVRGVVTPDGLVTFEHVSRLFAAGTYAEVMWFSVRLSLWVTVLSVLVGYPVAYVLATLDQHRRSTWMLFILLPFWSSFLVRMFSWIIVLGREGPVNSALVSTGVSSGPRELLYSWGAVVLGMTNVLIPFAILTMVGVMVGIDRSLVRAAGTLGAHPIQAFTRVYLPLSMPGVTAAALLVFITSLGFFISPALLGSPKETMIAQLLIQQVQDLINWPFAAIICIMLLSVALAIFWVFDRAVGLSTLAGESTDITRSKNSLSFATLLLRPAWLIGDGLAQLNERICPKRISASTSPTTRLAAILVIAFLLVPLVFLVPISVSSRGYVAWPPVGFTAKWYGELLSSPLWASAAARSFVVASMTALCCFVIAVPAAFAFLRLKGTTASVVFSFLVSPMIVPRIVIGISLFYVYARIGLVGTLIGLILGHTLIAFPFFFVAVIAVLKTYDRRLDQAAASLGAGPWSTARHVTLPLVSTGLISAALFAFVISFDDLNIALFTSGGLQTTLPKLMWDEATTRFSPLLAAASTLLLVAISLLVLLATRLQGSSTETSRAA